VSESGEKAKRRARAVAVQTFLEFRAGTLRNHRGEIVTDAREASRVCWRREMRAKHKKLLLVCKPKA